MQELENTVIDHHYQIQSLLTRGGMAEIYLAQDQIQGCLVVLKMVHTSAGDYCTRFRQEARMMTILTHTHILPVLDYGEYQSWCYLVTPYIESGTLAAHLKQGPLSLEEAGCILEQLSQALHYAHEQGIVHRDIKPSNVLLQDGQHVYLADFGLVKRVGEDTGVTETGYLIGTPEYMAPELAEEEASPSSDLYALAILLYQMLTGHVPFVASTPMATYLKHIREWPLPPSTRNPNLPPSVDRVILRALSKDPRRRFQTVREFSAAYQQALTMKEEPATPQEIPYFSVVQRNDTASLPRRSDLVGARLRSPLGARLRSPLGARLRSPLGARLRSPLGTRWSSTPPSIISQLSGGQHPSVGSDNRAAKRATPARRILAVAFLIPVLLFVLPVFVNIATSGSGTAQVTQTQKNVQKQGHRVATTMSGTPGAQHTPIAVSLKPHISQAKQPGASVATTASAPASGPQSFQQPGGTTSTNGGDDGAQNTMYYNIARYQFRKAATNQADDDDQGGQSGNGYSYSGQGDNSGQNINVDGRHQPASDDNSHNNGKGHNDKK